MREGANHNFIRPIGRKPIRLEPQEAELYSDARDTLALLWEVEDLFEASVSALLSLEQTLLLDALNYSVLGEISDGNPTQTRATLNSKLGNLLFSGRSYEELSRAKIKKRLPDLECALAEIYSEAFNNCLEYRLMYALRNSMTHGDLAILSVSFCGQRESSNDSAASEASRSHHFIEPTVRISDLLKMRKLKCGVKPLIKANFSEYEKIDLRIFWRNFFLYSRTLINIFGS